MNVDCISMLTGLIKGTEGGGGTVCKCYNDFKYRFQVYDSLETDKFTVWLKADKESLVPSQV